MDPKSLEFFNRISAILKIELTEPAKKMNNLENLVASKESQIKDLKLESHVYDEKSGDFRDLTEQELNRVVFEHNKIALKSLGEEIVIHQAPNGEHFTVKELLKAIEVTELKSRGGSDWLGGVDVHHVFFEGLHQCDNGIWEIYWGS